MSDSITADPLPTNITVNWTELKLKLKDYVDEHPKQFQAVMQYVRSLAPVHPPTPTPSSGPDDSARNPLQAVFIVLAVAVAAAFLGVMIFAVLRERSRRAYNGSGGSGNRPRSVPRANRMHGGSLINVITDNNEDCDRSVITMDTDEEGSSSSSSEKLSVRAVNDFAKLFAGEGSKDNMIRNRTRSGSGSTNSKRRPLLGEASS